MSWSSGSTAHSGVVGPEKLKETDNGILGIRRAHKNASLSGNMLV